VYLHNRINSEINTNKNLQPTSEVKDYQGKKMLEMSFDIKGMVGN